MKNPAARFLTLAAVVSLLASCQNGQNPFSSGSNSSDPYVGNYGSDGGYNPYPGQSGYAQGGSSSGGGYSSVPTYTAPPAPAEADPYAFNAPSSTPPKTSSSSSSSSRKSTSTSRSKPSSTAKKSSSGGSYKVAKGDTLYGIARKRGTTVAKIKSANKLSSDIIRPGQTLRIP